MPTFVDPEPCRFPCFDDLLNEPAMRRLAAERRIDALSDALRTSHKKAPNKRRHTLRLPSFKDGWNGDEGVDAAVRRDIERAGSTVVRVRGRSWVIEQQEA